MRKSLWIIPVLLLFAAIGAPVAHAGTLYEYTYTETSNDAAMYGFTWTTDPIPALTGSTSLPGADLLSSSVMGTFWANCESITSVTLDKNGDGAQETDWFHPPTEECESGTENQFTLADYDTPGTYVDSAHGDTLTVTAVTSPEPSAAGRLLAGIGLVFAMALRKRPAPRESMSS